MALFTVSLSTYGNIKVGQSRGKYFNSLIKCCYINRLSADLARTKKGWTKTACKVLYIEILVVGNGSLKKPEIGNLSWKVGNEIGKNEVGKFEMKLARLMLETSSENWKIFDY